MLALVLDDAETNNLVMVASLRPLAGCVPHDFTVPAEALAFAEARASEIGVVITDYEMPSMNGIEFIRAVRRVPGLAHVPTVMVTSHDQRSLRRKALEAGATDFLTTSRPTRLRSAPVSRTCSPSQRLTGRSATTPRSSPARSLPRSHSSRSGSARSSRPSCAPPSTVTRTQVTISCVSPPMSG
ncbi:protein of unknown function [Methylorubrum extorquens]|uniref:Response regulatory domain-containing protein n=1 Tax=Methylorubrum extorquens TaxID=408 RepID=A0A2N9AXN0_METEX|nr:protein of unknown function [Methylorubrum extorquens]